MDKRRQLLETDEGPPVATREFENYYENEVKQLVRAIPGGVANPFRARPHGKLAAGW